MPQALAKLDSGAPGTPGRPTVDADLAADFLALGFTHYLIESITVGIRYMTTLDESALEQELLAAATAACSGDTAEARTRLQAAFDLLHSSLDYHYPSESHLMDLTLAASTTLGNGLRSQLVASGRTVWDGLAIRPTETQSAPGGDSACNLLISGQVLQEMAEREPATLAALRDALQRGAVSIVGGEFCELELPLLGPEAIRAQLEKGLSIYRKHLGSQPSVFGRRRFGMTPILPQILDHLRFTGVVHATLDDGSFPVGATGRLRWEGIDGTMLEALFRVPIDASRGDGFVRMPRALYGYNDLDNQTTLLFAHWPGKTSPWYEDLHRARRYTTALGSFITLPAYFEHSGMSGHTAAPKADEYRSPYLRQAVAAGQPDPISRWVRYSRQRMAAEAAQSIAALATLAGGKPSVCVDGLLDDIDESLATAADGNSLDRRLTDLHLVATFDFAQAIGARPAPVRQADHGYMVPEPDIQQTGQAGKPDVLTASEAPAGLLVINPLSFSRRIYVDASALDSLPEAAGAVLRAAEESGRKSIVVEVPPLGYACVVPGGGPTSAAPAPRRFGLFRPISSRLAAPPAPPPMAELIASGGAVLRNEFFELAIDPHTGAIRSIFDFHSRAPRLAQQVAMRLPGTAIDEEAYSIMAADEIRVLAADLVQGEVLVRGRLLDRGPAPGRVSAIDPRHLGQPRDRDGDRNRSPTPAGGRPLELLLRGSIRLGARCGDTLSRRESSDGRLGHGVSGIALVRRDSGRAGTRHAPGRRTAILAAGLPYHRRRGLRKLDTLLLVRGETARRFRLGIALDAPQPMAAALDFAAPSPTTTMRKWSGERGAGSGEPDVLLPAPSSQLPAPSAWLFHLDSRAVISTHWSPVVKDGSLSGFCVRLLETQGRHATIALRSFRAVHGAEGRWRRPSAHRFDCRRRPDRDPHAALRMGRRAGRLSPRFLRVKGLGRPRLPKAVFNRPGPIDPGRQKATMDRGAGGDLIINPIEEIWP